MFGVMDAISFVIGWAVGIATLLLGYYGRKPATVTPPPVEETKVETDRQWQRLMEYRGVDQTMEGRYEDEE